MRAVFFVALALIATLAVDTTHREHKRDHVNRVPAGFNPQGCQSKLEELCGRSQSPEAMGKCASDNEQSLVTAGCLSKEAVVNCRQKAHDKCPPGEKAEPKAIFDCLQQNRAFLEENGCPVPPAEAAQQQMPPQQQTPPQQHA
eukprot:CAMPEP_0197520970 /NCGR_PEP_ID=MMETSP1318-20131121/6281_1 /TAXON_ID=552666 /ORGANISM="Partenskyella glossopodia, Strain RCC365" /LENGTH=142 /DNA_ID=CAMNT_0043072759 /DNA_START=64 /DNA_END=492 /DNA_ORIENTATION=+